jgi:hypothetical protein
MAAFIGNHTQRHANLNPPMRQFLLTGVYSQSFRVCCPGAAHDPQGDYQLSEKSKKVRTFKGFGWCCQRGSNSRPLPYQGSALPLSYGSAPTGRAAYCHRAALHASLKMIFIRPPGLSAPEAA